MKQFLKKLLLLVVICAVIISRTGESDCRRSCITARGIIAALAAAASGNGFEYFKHPPRAFTAGNAFAAAFSLYEVHEELGYVHHTGVLVHDDESAGPHHRSSSDQRVIVDRCVEKLFRYASA